MTEGSHFLYKPISRKFSQLVLNLVFCQSPAGRPLVTCSFLKLQKSKLYNGLFNPEKLSSKCFIWLLPYLHQPLLHLCDLIHILWHHTPTKLLIWSTLYYLQCSLLYFSINGTPPCCRYISKPIYDFKYLRWKSADMYFPDHDHGKTTYKRILKGKWRKTR